MGDALRLQVDDWQDPSREITSHIFSFLAGNVKLLTGKMESAWDKERKFEIEKVSPVYLLTALFVVPFGIYFLLNFLSPLIHRITAMTISEVCQHEFDHSHC